MAPSATIYHHPRCSKSREALALLIQAGADDAAVMAFMAASPTLIERTMVETAKGVVIGRPPQAVRSIL